MSVDPIASSVANAAASNTAAIDALITAELNALAADAQALQEQVTVGQVVQAQVLPSNGVTDLISILGNRVAAALPPSLTVGDVFTAQVTGFDGPQILLQVLSTSDGAVSSTPTPLPGLPTELMPDEPPPTPLAAAATRPPLPEGVSPSVAPPPAVFVAASVRQSPSTDPAAVPGAPVAKQISATASTAALTGLADIEARLAAARTGQVSITAPNVPNAANLPPVAQNPLAGRVPVPAPPALPAALNPQLIPQIPSRFVIAPAITPSTRVDTPSANAPIIVPAATDAAPLPSGIAAYQTPASLVRALNLPVTASNLAAAKLALTSPQRLPAALATLESALPQSDDPRVATLRTLTAFFGKIDPSSPQLASQISSYVENVVTGNEPKLVALLTAQLASDPPSPGPAAAATAAAAPAVATETAPAAAAAAAQVAVVPEATYPAMALAQAVLRSAELSVDLKTQLISIIANAPVAAGDDLVPAAASALSAITSVQLNAAQAMNANPSQMQFTLPMWVGSGYAQAHLAIDREAPGGGGEKRSTATTSISPSCSIPRISEPSPSICKPSVARFRWRLKPKMRNRRSASANRSRGSPAGSRVCAIASIPSMPRWRADPLPRRPLPARWKPSTTASSPM